MRYKAESGSGSYLTAHFSLDCQIVASQQKFNSSKLTDPKTKKVMYCKLQYELTFYFLNPMQS